MIHHHYQFQINQHSKKITKFQINLLVLLLVKVVIKSFDYKLTVVVKYKYVKHDQNLYLAVLILLIV